MYAIDTNINYDGKSQEDNDISMMDHGDISPSGASNPHNR